MKVLTFGEILLRLASPGYTRFFQKDCLETSFCGAEANVAVSLAILGVDSAFLTKLPKMILRFRQLIHCAILESILVRLYMVMDVWDYII